MFVLFYSHLLSSILAYSLFLSFTLFYNLSSLSSLLVSFTLFELEPLNLNRKSWGTNSEKL